MRQAQKEIDQSLDFLGVVHAPVCVLSTEGSSASGAFFPCFNTAAPCFSMEKMLPRHCSLRCFAHTQAHAVPTPKKSCDWSISFCACVIVFVSNARVNNVLFHLCCEKLHCMLYFVELQCTSYSTITTQGNGCHAFSKQ